MHTKYSITASHVNTNDNIKLLAQGWDWPVAGCQTLSDYVNKATFDTSRTFFWLYEEELPVAFFGFSLHPNFNSFQTGTFIAPEHRGHGINSVIKLASIVAFQAMELPLIATVLEENNRSLQAMRKISGNHGLPFDEKYRNTKSYLFELNNVEISFNKIDVNLFKNILILENRFSSLISIIPTPKLAFAA